MIPVASPLPVNFHFTLPILGTFRHSGPMPMVVADLPIGFLFVLAISSLGIYGIALAGWSSNSKYSLMGGLRASAQMISYELSMGLAVVGVVLVGGSLNLVELIQAQMANGWNVFYQPLGLLIFFISALAETNRAPFDLPEAEPELVGGYHTEYSGMKFGLLYLAEYANILASSAIMATLYLGGWDIIPFVDEAALLGLDPSGLIMVLAGHVVFLSKAFLLVFVFIWIRWSLPRFRYDQLMNLGWKVLLPLSLANIAVTGIVMLLIDMF